MESVTIAISGIIFHFKIDAFETLKKQLHKKVDVSINHHGKISLQSRIVEFLLHQLQEGKQVIDLSDIYALFDHIESETNIHKWSFSHF